MKTAKTETDLSGKTKPGVEPFCFFFGGGVTGGIGFLLVSTIFLTKLITRNVAQAECSWSGEYQSPQRDRIHRAARNY